MTIEGHALSQDCSPDAPKDVIYTVTDVYPEHVVLDGNHPLSGMALRIAITITGVRAATEQEKATARVALVFLCAHPVRQRHAALRAYCLPVEP